MCSGVLRQHLKHLLQSDLISEHERDDLQHVHTPLLLTLGRRQELDQVVEAAHVNGPQHAVMDAGIVVHFLHRRAESQVGAGGFICTNMKHITVEMCVRTVKCSHSYNNSVKSQTFSSQGSAGT